MKEKLIFSCRWNKDRRNSWSGSAYAIHQELEKFYKVEDFDIKDSLAVTLFRIFRKLHLVKGEPSLLSLISMNQKNFEKEYGTEKVKVFQFSEIPYNENTENYVYQDLSVEFILNMKRKDPVAYSYCGFTNLSEKELLERIEIQKKYYDHCSGIFTMGNWLRDFMVNECNIAPNKVHAVGAGINVPVDRIDYSKKCGNKFLFVGKDFQRKGGELVVEAFVYLKKHYMPEAELYILGPKENPLQDEKEGITYVGTVSQEVVSQYYNMCDVFCMPSYFEAYGIVFCEALAYGLPCLARDKFAMKELVVDGEDGYLVEDDDVASVAKKMYDLIRNHEMAENVKSKRDWYLENYSWKKVAEKMNNVMGV